MQRWQAAKSTNKISGQGIHLATHTIFHVYPWAGVRNVISPELSYWLLIFKCFVLHFQLKDWSKVGICHRGCECCSCFWNNIHEKSPVSPRSTCFAPPLRVGYLVFVKIIYPKDWMVNSRRRKTSRFPVSSSLNLWGLPGPPVFRVHSGFKFWPNLDLKLQTSISSRSKHLQASPSCPNLSYGSKFCPCSPPWRCFCCR